jgi:CHRD domain
MKKSFIHSTCLISGLSLILISCDKDDPVPIPPPTIVKEWTIPLSAKYENNPPAGRTETGTANIKLLSDNTIAYTIAVVGLAATDALTAAHIHVGDVITNGSVILGFSPVFSGSNASGTIANIRTTFIDSLKDNVNELYFNVHSTQVPGGLVRGQLNSMIEMAEYVTLSGANEVPANTSAATGGALIRMTADKKVYIKLTTANLEAGDAWTAAHIHKAAAGANGSVILGFYANAADFGTVKISTATEALFTSLKTDAIYFNAHSTTKPGGLIRGQIR